MDRLDSLSTNHASLGAPVYGNILAHLAPLRRPWMTGVPKHRQVLPRSVIASSAPCRRRVCHRLSQPYRDKYCRCRLREPEDGIIRTGHMKSRDPPIIYILCGSQHKPKIEHIPASKNNPKNKRLEHIKKYKVDNHQQQTFYIAWKPADILET